MAEWQAELEALLSHLHVSFEDGAVARRPNASVPRRRVEDGAVSDSAVIPFREDDALVSDDLSTDDDEVSAVRSEIEATLRRVVELTHEGKLDPHVRDDVIFVFQALTRPLPRGARPRARATSDSSGEWQLTSAAAVLHFCRIVLRMTQAVADEPDL